MRRPGYQARRPARSPQQLRQDWLGAIMLSGRLAGEAEAGDAQCAPSADYGQNLTRLVIGLRDLEAGNFPLQSESARSMAGAFLILARAFCHPGWSPQARTACAPFLKAGAACLDGLVDGLRRQEAEHGRRVLGEREDD